MNSFQRVWWEQARSEHAVLQLLRSQEMRPCHQLHYLQMVTEKLAKAYLWRTGKPPPKSHAAFVAFLSAVAHRRAADRDRIATCLGFGIGSALEHWIPTVKPLAHALERLAPSLAGDDRPNPEYPWPREAPAVAPTAFDFTIWAVLNGTGRGRQLLKVIDAAVDRFPEYA